MKITRGTTRLVILIKSYAIKLPDFTRILQRKGWFFFLKGIIQNEEERKTWQLAQVDMYDESRLCPIIWSSWGGWIVIMQRAKPLSNLTWSLVQRDSQDWINQGLGQDIKRSNFGTIRGRIVKVDYGL